MKKSKISTMQLSRLLIQIIFFIFLPSLYINTFAGIKQIYLAILRHNTSFMQLIPQLVEAAVIIPFTIIMGRFFCGWMCAFGSFGDFIYKITHKLFKVKFRMDEDIDRRLKYVKYVLLAFLIFVICSFNITSFSTFSPWDVFGMLTTVGKTPALSYVALNLTAGFIIFLLIVVGSVFVERFFCRYLCPLGAVFAITSKLRITKIRKERTKCGNCRICTKNCAMGIPLYKMDAVDSGECINCMQCITACPRNNTTFTVTGEDVRPLAAGVAVAATMTGLYYAGNLGLKAAGLNNAYSVSQSTASSNQYADGTYEGSGTGFRGGTTTVSVVVKNGKITDISTVSYQDDRPFYSRAYNTVVQEIISSQSTDVNAVSGATFSSRGIMEAVGNALSSAKVSSSTNVTSSSNSDSNQTQASSNQTQASNGQNQIDTTQSADSQTSRNAETLNNQQNESSKSTEVTASASEVKGQYKDGSYEGSGTGFRGGTTTVSVVVKNGKITDISTVSYQDDRPFYSRAFDTITQEIISNQNSSVDAVSGATFSSHGIMQAVENALSKAK